ncbi:MAG: acyltransferase family protein, partial [Candidatus Nomurabacteria bacterium]|nr:acyltransferase family protein [Candidatus Nomurabacteria bacterium]
MKSQLRANTTIDSLRNILIILVIMVHMSGVAVLSQFSAAEGLVYDVLMAITLFCIPAFFAIAGFFAYQKDNSPTANQKRLKRIWSLLKILIWAELLYIALSSLFVGLPSVLGAFADKGHLLNFLSDAVPVPTIFDSLLLYYIVVLLFVSTITLGFGKYRDKLLAILAIVAFVIANLGFYLLHIRGYAVVDQYVGTGQNRVLAGLLYFSIGYFIRKYQTKLSKIKTKLIVVLFLATLALFALEKIYFTPYGVTAPIVVALGLSLCVKFPNLFSNKAKIIPAI